MRNFVKILELLAEGGSLKLYGVKFGNKWYFSLRSVDQTPEVLDEEWIARQSSLVETFEIALKLLDEYPWHKPYPEFIHSDFQSKAYEAFLRKCEKNESSPIRYLNEWQIACGK